MFIRLLLIALLCLFTIPSRCDEVVLKGEMMFHDKEETKHKTIYITLSQGEARIKEVSEKAPDSGAKIIDTKGIIFPGLIDLHNHLTWNILPHWRANQYFYNRYQWQIDQAYLIALDTPHQIADTEDGLCDTDQYAEVKAIIGGATSVVGSPSAKTGISNKCIEGLARNLDAYPDFDTSSNKKVLSYKVRPLDMSIQEMETAKENLVQSKEALIVHLAEGLPQDRASSLEFGEFIEKKKLDAGEPMFLRKGVSIVHGTALKRGDFLKMAKHNVGLVWSPRSNIELYDVTTDVATAKEAEVKIAIGPDWSPTGSSGMLDELKYAATWNRANLRNKGGKMVPVFSDWELVEMATKIPAELAGVSDKIGEINKGAFADLIVIKMEKGDAPSYDKLLRSNPRDLSLVIIGSKMVYGDKSFEEYLPLGFRSEKPEALKVCGVDKVIETATLRLRSFKALSESLAEKLRTQGSALAPYATCEDSNQK